MKRCLECDYTLEFIESAACPECGRAFSADDPATYHDDRRLRAPSAALAAFLFGWPGVALLYAFFLAIFEGIWGDPWYGTWRMHDLADVRNLVFYLGGGAVLVVTSGAWFWAALVITARGDWPDTRILALWCYGLICLGCAAILLGDVMRTFVEEAFQY